MIGNKDNKKKQNLPHLSNQKTLKKLLDLFNELEKEHSFDEIIELVKIKKAESQLDYVPIGIFNHKELGMLESLVKFLKENKNQKYSNIGRLLDRDQRTIWNTYNKATKKNNTKLQFSEDDLLIPIEIFKNRKLGPLEILCVYLKKQGLNFSEIARLLSRDPRTIWAAHNKGVKKQ